MSLDYYDTFEGSNFPGERTHPLSIIEEDFYHYSMKRLFSSFFDIDASTTWEGDTCFQKIYSFHEQKHHPMNTGWVHIDNNMMFAAVVYLNKNTCLDSGTTIFHPNSKYSDSDFSSPNYQYRNDLYRNVSVDEESYIKSLQDHNDKFDSTLEFKNRYNRMIAYDGKTWHKESCFWVPEKFRLTQVFFIRSFGSYSKRKILPTKLLYS